MRRGPLQRLFCYCAILILSMFVASSGFPSFDSSLRAYVSSLLEAWATTAEVQPGAQAARHTHTLTLDAYPICVRSLNSFNPAHSHTTDWTSLLLCEFRLGGLEPLSCVYCALAITCDLPYP